MKNNKFILFVCLFVAMIFMLPTSNANVFAEETKIYVSFFQEDNFYIINAQAYDESAEIIFDVNGVKLYGNEGSIMLQITDQTYEIFAEASIYNVEGVIIETIRSSTLVLKPNVQNGSDIIDSKIAKQIIFNGIIPVVLALGSIGLLLWLCFRKKQKPIEKIILNIKHIKGSINETVSLLNNNEIKNKKKQKQYKKYLKTLNKTIARDIDTVITLNIESLGQYNTLLSSLLKFENIIKALFVSTIGKDDNYIIKQLNKINKKFVTLLLENALEIEKTFDKIENQKNSLFVQHIKTSEKFKDSDICESYLEKTLNAKTDDGEENSEDNN